METLFLYIAKSSGLIALFFTAYFLLLRKETFFTANRWFLLAGLFTSVILPWLFFTTIVWVEPTPTNFDWPKVPATSIEEESFKINWDYIMLGIYSIGFLIFIIKFALDFYSLNSVLKDKKGKRQADFRFIDTNENIAPFSYFNTIVYNSSLYSTSEMQSILEHEKVHSEQYHTIDVLITRVFCILFWFNPFIWLYQKAILQNLEFIADSEALKNISDKKAYQLTLLKITTHENCAVITNHFYQSLIKKRIVMLNKNQSKKSNSWKYLLVIPVLVAFVFLFQIEVIAKEKNHPLSTEKSITISKSKDIDVYQINKNTSEAELEETMNAIKSQYGIEVRFSGTKRNSNNELTAITVKIKKDNELSQKRAIKSSNTIQSFAIVIKKDSDGNTTVEFTENNRPNHRKEIIISNDSAPNINISDETKVFIDDKESDKTEMKKLDPKEIASINVIKNDDNKEIRIFTNKHVKILNENEIYINDKKVDANDLNVINQHNIESVDVNKEGKTIRIITRNGNYNTQNLPAAPVHPVPPVKTFKTPKHPVWPKAPTPPRGGPNGDPKAWKEFEKRMDEFEAKMEKLQPQIEVFDKQMADFDKQMEEYSKQMEEYSKQMEEYGKHLEESRK
ncbi:M56 family metallopeptidase [Flavobacterium adhaerens]|uniref:M56 family metallopeptidase n=1 Tax=Flavobacterium adhaerens TaxID=3149043 RepID=UPI0032B532DC